MLARDVTGKVDMPDTDAFGTRHGAETVTFVRGNVLRLALVAGIGLALANCSGPATKTSKVDPKYGVAASPLVVSDGSEIPRGGGREMVGRSYTIAGRTYTPRRDESYSDRGLASWYGPGFHGRQTANGEVFDQHAISAAHTTMPLPSYARVTNLDNSRSLIVRVNDRGPFHGNRIIDVSKTVAEALDFRQNGVGRVQVDYVGPAHVDGSDDQILISTLRTDGQMAQLPDQGTRPGATMLAEATPPAQAEPAATHASFAAAQPDSGTAASGVAGEPLAVGGGAVLAGLFFASPQGETQTLSRDSAFAGLATANQRSLRRAR